MSEPAFWLLFTAAVIVTAILTAPVRLWLLRHRQLDLPDARRSHVAPTPRGGGLAIVVTLVLAWLLWPGARTGWWPLMTCVVLMAVVGWFDDRHQLPVRLRFVVQLFIAAGLLAAVGGLNTVGLFGWQLNAPWLWTPLGGIAVIWLINLYNFMDGADGMAAGQGLWAGLVSSLLFEVQGQPDLATFAIAAAGAWGGFLFWNRPPAGIFMGDVGSLALGVMIAACAVTGASTGAISIWVSFMISSVFVVDATATLLSRVARGERWYTPHRQHAYQRLLAMGWSHGQVFGLYALINLFVVLPVILAAVRWPRLDTGLAAGLALVLAMGWRVVQSAVTVNNDKA